MCGRYALFQIEQLRERFRIANNLPGGLKARYNIGPSQLEPVVVQRNGASHIEVMKWGFIPRWAKDAKSIFRYKTFNARSEGIFEKPLWKTAIRRTRCLVPANGFYEWKDAADGKQPFYINPSDISLFSFAGLYGRWQDQTGFEWGTYSIITTQPNRDMSPIHDRMPVILQPGDEALWLDPTVDDDLLTHLMEPYPDDRLNITEVSRDVNAIKSDDAHLITPIHDD
ncbi:MAG: SOS response-associated peptidase [Candidatus Saccharimonadales bacterium]